MHLSLHMIGRGELEQMPAEPLGRRMAKVARPVSPKRGYIKPGNAGQLVVER